jgi:diguanylate cyclase (GGDEF)-like protein
MRALGSPNLVHAPPPSSWPRSVVYPALGALLALGAPGGLCVLRRLLAGDVSIQGVLLDVTRDATTYVYLTVSTSLVFVTLGVLLGRSVDRLMASATTDPLTELANRRHFDERVVLEVKRAQRYGSSLSLLLIDVDRLKQINDQHGHEAGDAALRRVAAALSASCRATDLVARWGGDEFTVLAPGTDADEALRLAGRIREALRRGHGAFESSPTTVSVGVAHVARAGTDTPEGLCAAADSALYEAKTGGRDRAVVYAGTKSPPANPS